MTSAAVCSDPNPLIRALAVRTMGCIRVESISEYLCESLRSEHLVFLNGFPLSMAVCVLKLLLTRMLRESGADLHNCWAGARSRTATRMCARLQPSAW